MGMVSKLLLLAGAVSLVIALILALADIQIIATPNGWMDLSVVLAVFSIAVKFVHGDGGISG